MDENSADIKMRLDRIERRLDILLDKNDIDKNEILLDKNEIDYDLSKTGLLFTMSKYIDKNYNKISNGRVLVTSFHDKIIEALKNEKFELEAKTISPLMMHFFGFIKTKTCGDWYYTGLEEKQIHRPKLVILPNH